MGITEWLGWYGFRRYLQDKAKWSRQTFGTGKQTHRMIDHIRKELLEIEADPTSVEEWIDVVAIALDGACRLATADEVISILRHKFEVCQQRQFPDWRTSDPNKAIEHIRDNQ